MSEIKDLHTKLLKKSEDQFVKEYTNAIIKSFENEGFVCVYTGKTDYNTSVDEYYFDIK